MTFHSHDFEISEIGFQSISFLAMSIIEDAFYFSERTRLFAFLLFHVPSHVISRFSKATPPIVPSFSGGFLDKFQYQARSNLPQRRYKISANSQMSSAISNDHKLGSLLWHRHFDKKITGIN